MGARAGPYLSILKLLFERGLMKNLPVDDSGILRVNVPFCGNLGEYGALGDFFKQTCLSSPRIQEVELFATEVSDAYYYDWALAAKWFRKVHPKMNLQTS